MEFLAKTGNDKFRFSNEEEIIKYIIDNIEKISPIIDDRLFKDLKFQLNQEKVIINININKIENNEFTKISFKNGCNNCCSCTNDYLIINGVVSKTIIDGIFAYLLKDHDYVHVFNVSGTLLYIDLGLDYALSPDKGIGCSHIEIEFNFYRYGDYKELQQSFVNNIVTVFYDKLKNTDYVKRNLNYYINDFKEKNIKPMSDIEVLDFMKNFTIDELKELICNLGNEKFIDVCNRYLNNKNEDTFIKKLMP